MYIVWRGFLCVFADMSQWLACCGAALLCLFVAVCCSWGRMCACFFVLSSCSASVDLQFLREIHNR